MLTNHLQEVEIVSSCCYEMNTIRMPSTAVKWGISIEGCNTLSLIQIPHFECLIFGSRDDPLAIGADHAPLTQLVWP